MINLIRKHQQALMVMITVLVIIAFVWFYNGTRSVDKIGTDRVAIMYGRSVSRTDIDREARRYQIALELGLYDVVRGLGTLDQNQQTDNFVFNIVVLRHEAKLLQIEPTDEEVKNAMLELPAFQTNGTFDARKLTSFVSEKLMPRGFTETQIDDLMRDKVRLAKVKSVVTSVADITPTEFRSAYELQHQKTQASVLRLKLADLAATVQVSDDDVKKAYEQRKDSLKSDEIRKVKFVTLTLSDAEKAHKGKERIEALQNLANKANDFTQAMLEKSAGFDQVAAKFSLPVSATGDFTQYKPDPKLEKFPGITEAAFKITEQDPNSDVIQTEDGFYILHLEKVIPSAPLTFDEAKAPLTSQLKNERARELLSQKSADVRKTLEEQLKAGKSFADAAIAAGQKAEPLPAFSMADPGKIETPEQQEILSKAIMLGDGQLSEFIPTNDGGIFIHIDKRLPIDEAQFEKDKIAGMTSARIGARELVFREWLRLRRNAAKIMPAR